MPLYTRSAQPRAHARAYATRQRAHARAHALKPGNRNSRFFFIKHKKNGHFGSAWTEVLWPGFPWICLVEFPRSESHCKHCWNMSPLNPPFREALVIPSDTTTSRPPDPRRPTCPRLPDPCLPDALASRLFSFWLRPYHPYPGPRNTQTAAHNTHSELAATRTRTRTRATATRTRTRTRAQTWKLIFSICPYKTKEK